MCNSNDNVIQGCLSKNYLTQIIPQNIRDLRYSIYLDRNETKYVAVDNIVLVLGCVDEQKAHGVRTVVSIAMGNKMQHSWALTNDLNPVFLTDLLCLRII